LRNLPLTNYKRLPARMHASRVSRQRARHPLEAAPFFAMTSLKTRFKPLAKRLGTRCAFCDPQRERTSTTYADFLRGRFFPDRSCKSNLRSSRRSQAQNFPAGRNADSQTYLAGPRPRQGRATTNEVLYSPRLEESGS
jgi:hypothetical protein